MSTATIEKPKGAAGTVEDLILQRRARTAAVIRRLPWMITRDDDGRPLWAWISELYGIGSRSAVDAIAESGFDPHLVVRRKIPILRPNDQGPRSNDQGPRLKAQCPRSNDQGPMTHRR